MAIADTEPKKTDVDVTSTGGSKETLGSGSKSPSSNKEYPGTGSTKMYGLYYGIKGFAFSMPDGWDDRNIGIFIECCRENIEEFQHPAEDENRIWHKIAKSGAEKSGSVKCFTVNSCIELAECLKSYVMRNNKRIDNEAFRKLYDDVIDLLQYFPGHADTINKIMIRGRSESIDEKSDLYEKSVHSTENNSVNQKELVGSHMPVSSLQIDKLIAMYCKKHKNMFPKTTSTYIWSKISSNLNEKHGIKIDVKKRLDMLKRNIAKEVKNETNFRSKLNKFLTLANEFADYFDYMPPKTIKKKDLLGPEEEEVKKKENEVESLQCEPTVDSQSFTNSRDKPAMEVKMSKKKPKAAKELGRKRGYNRKSVEELTLMEDTAQVNEEMDCNITPVNSEISVSNISSVEANGERLGLVSETANTVPATEADSTSKEAVLLPIAIVTVPDSTESIMEDVVLKGSEGTEMEVVGNRKDTEKSTSHLNTTPGDSLKKSLPNARTRSKMNDTEANKEGNLPNKESMEVSKIIGPKPKSKTNNDIHGNKENSNVASRDYASENENVSSPKLRSRSSEGGTGKENCDGSSKDLTEMGLTMRVSSPKTRSKNINSDGKNQDGNGGLNDIPESEIPKTRSRASVSDVAIEDGVSSSKEVVENANISSSKTRSKVNDVDGIQETNIKESKDIEVGKLPGTKGKSKVTNENLASSDDAAQDSVEVSGPKTRSRSTEAGGNVDSSNGLSSPKQVKKTSAPKVRVGGGSNSGGDKDVGNKDEHRVASADEAQLKKVSPTGFDINGEEGPNSFTFENKYSLRSGKYMIKFVNPKPKRSRKRGVEKIVPSSEEKVNTTSKRVLPQRLVKGKTTYEEASPPDVEVSNQSPNSSPKGNSTPELRGFPPEALSPSSKYKMVYALRETEKDDSDLEEAAQKNDPIEEPDTRPKKRKPQVVISDGTRSGEPVNTVQTHKLRSSKVTSEENEKNEILDETVFKSKKRKPLTVSGPVRSQEVLHLVQTHRIRSKDISMEESSLGSIYDSDGGTRCKNAVVMLHDIKGLPLRSARVIEITEVDPPKRERPRKRAYIANSPSTSSSQGSPRELVVFGKSLRSRSNESRAGPSDGPSAYNSNCVPNQTVNASKPSTSYENPSVAQPTSLKSNTQVRESVTLLDDLDASTVAIIERYKNRVEESAQSNAVMQLLPGSENTNSVSAPPSGPVVLSSTSQSLSLPTADVRVVSNPPEWFGNFVTDYRKQEMWKMHQLLKMQQELVDVENKKLAVLEKILGTLKKDP